MDKCREEFEVVARKNGWNLTTYPEITGRIDYVNVLTEQAWQMFQHQQAKVEELQKQFDQHDKLLLQRNKDVQELYNINEKHAAEKAELQKRVDSVTHLIRGLRAEFDLWMDVECPQVERQIELLEQALKGEG